MDERKFVSDFPYPSDVVARELLRQIDETFDQSPYLFIRYVSSLRAHQRRWETIPDNEDWLLTGERDPNGAWIVDEGELSAYQRKLDYETGDEYDFGAIRTFTVMAHRHADLKNPEMLRDPQSVRCEIMPRADGVTRVVLRCDAPLEVEDDGLDEDERRDLAAQRAHCEAAARYCGLLMAKMQETLGAEPAQAPGDPALQAEGIVLLRQMQPILTEVATGMRDLQAGQERILARFDQQEQHILEPILAQLDAQQAEQTTAVLDALEARTFPADDLGPTWPSSKWRWLSSTSAPRRSVIGSLRKARAR